MHNFHIFRNQTCQLDKIVPLENGTLVTFVNNCLYAMIEQLNNFACYVESRMITLNRKIDTCNSNLVILEMKLNSINIPNELAASVEKNDSIATNASANQASSTVDGVSTPNVMSVSIPKQNQLESNEVNVSESSNVINNEEEDVTAEKVEQQEEDMSEELEKYRKMLKFGVHESAVRQKMLIEGIDPARLNL